MTLDETLPRLIARWRSDPGTVIPGRDAGDVRRVFEQLGSWATEDVVQLFTHCGGLSGMDGEMWEFWTLERIVDDNLEMPRKGVLFADFAVNCIFLLLRPVDAATSDVWRCDFGDAVPTRIAPSVAAFVERYLQGDGFIWRPAGA